MTDSDRKIDYLVVGSGIAGLVFGALMARAGKHVVILEAHERAGGYGHTFQMGSSARFNAQLHYVWNCGEGQTVHKILSRLGLQRQITFETLDSDGFDHMIMPGYAVKIPASSAELVRRLGQLFPQDRKAIQAFVDTVNRVSKGLDLLAGMPSLSRIAREGIDALVALRYLRNSLQEVFDKFRLPLAAQTLLASQWPDFLLPPEKLSFYAWVMLFTGYQRGAYYPTRHFEHVIESLVDTVRAAGGEVRLQHEVTGFLLQGKTVQGVRAKDRGSGRSMEIHAATTVCNMDPQKAATMIGLEHFSRGIRRRLRYEYSPSNFMVYCAVEGLDLGAHGFGRWNTFHTGHEDLNKAFNAMYCEHDYSNPSFAITTPGFMTADRSDRPEGQEIVELLTVADYSYFRDLRQNDKAAYRRKKREVIDALFDAVERHYIPEFRRHLVFKTGGTPTTNEEYCLSPQGNSYGSNMTPENIGRGRLTATTSLNNFYFCNASSGFAGFAGTFWTGATLYQRLSGNRFL